MPPPIKVRLPRSSSSSLKDSPTNSSSITQSEAKQHHQQVVAVGSISRQEDDTSILRTPSNASIHRSSSKRGIRGRKNNNNNNNAKGGISSSSASTSSSCFRSNTPVSPSPIRKTNGRTPRSNYRSRKNRNNNLSISPVEIEIKTSSSSKDVKPLILIPSFPLSSRKNEGTRAKEGNGEIGLLNYEDPLFSTTFEASSVLSQIHEEGINENPPSSSSSSSLSSSPEKSGSSQIENNDNVKLDQKGIIKEKEGEGEKITKGETDNRLIAVGCCDDSGCDIDWEGEFNLDLLLS